MSDTYETFNSFPSPIKLEVFKHILNYEYVTKLSLVNKEWHSLLEDDFVWKPLFKQDYGHCHYEAQDETLGNSYWKTKYITFATKFWQWDNNKKSSFVSLSNSHFTATGERLSEEYYGIRTTRGVSSGSHFFEIHVDSQDPIFDKQFNDSRKMYFGMGIANSTFDVNDANTGWWEGNSGIGYYSDGQIFVKGESTPGGNRMRVGDRIGVYFSFEENIVKFFINGELAVEINESLSDELFPHILFANMKLTVTISSGKLNFPPYELTELQKARSEMRKGKKLFRKKEFELAIPYLERAISIYPLPNAWRFKGRCLRDLDRCQESLEAFAELVKMAPESPLSYNDRGVVYYRMRDFESALKEYDMATKLDPQDPVIRTNRADVLVELGNKDAAFQEYNQALTIDRTYTIALNNLGLLHYDCEHNEEAIQNYTDALAINPDYSIAYFNRALVYDKMQNLEEAVKDFGSAIEADPEFWEAYSCRGYCYERLDKYEDALVDYTAAIQGCPDNAKYYVNRAYVWEVYKGNLELALVDYHKAVEVNPKHDGAWNDMSAMYNLMGKYKEAIDSANKSIEISPEKANSYNHRGFATAMLGNKEKGLEDINKSVTLNPEYARAFCYRAYVLYLLKRYEEAMKDCEHVIKETPTDIPDVYYVRGLLHEEQGKLDSAVSDMQYCLDIEHKTRVFPVSQVQKDLEKARTKLTKCIVC